MAYNPFNFFRRNQKTIFAILTVFIMIMFTLSSGLGGGADFFDWLPQWLGRQAGKKGEHLCTIDGRKIYDGQLRELHRQRVMANRFMSLAAQQTMLTLNGVVSELSGKLSPEARSILQQASQQEGFLRFFASNPELAAQVPPLLEQIKATVARIFSLPNARSEDKEAARAKIAALSLMLTGTGEHYFTNLPNRHSRDLIEFLLWQKKADQYGIHLTRGDVARLIQDEFYGYFRSDVQVRKILQQQMEGFQMERCLDAIGEEFRVRLAQTILLGTPGPQPTGDRPGWGFPAFATTFELFQHYREQCSLTTLAAIPVPVANYLDRVTTQPSEDELRRLFEQYKNNDYNPTRETPGFKEPRRVRLAYFGVTGEEPYYRRVAEELLRKAEQNAQIGTALTVPLPGSSPVAVIGAIVPSLGGELALQQAYSRYQREQRSALLLRYQSANVSVDQLPEALIARPGTAAAAWAAGIGSSVGPGHPGLALGLAVGPPIAYELRQRVRSGVPLLLSLLPTPALLAQLVAADAVVQQTVPQPVPLEVVRHQLYQQLLRDTARRLAFGDSPAAVPGNPTIVVGDVQKFIDEVRKLSNEGRLRPSQKDKIAEVEKYIQEFTSSRGLLVRTNREPRHEWNLEEDPELAPLVVAQRESVRQAARSHGGTTYIPFGRSFFWRDPARREPLNTLYLPIYYPEERLDPFRRQTSPETSTQWIVWRVEEWPARTLTYSEARPMVLAEWKRQQARSLAQRDAEALAQAIRDNPQSQPATLKFVVDDERLRFASRFTEPAARDRIRPFLIEGVAPLTPIPNPTAQPLFPLIPTLPQPLQPFRIVPSDNVKYPARDMAQTLLDKRTEPPKTVFLLHDEPRDHFYVVTVLQRDVKSRLEFENAVLRAPTNDPNRNIILSTFQLRLREQTLQAVLSLLKQEFRYEETEEQKKKLDESERRREET
ncbi:MAG: hypothetical protein RMJ88_11575 [Thermogemmata sp.]|nr:hypothetical protein [Thermogemmata sp.]